MIQFNCSIAVVYTIEKDHFSLSTLKKINLDLRVFNITCFDQQVWLSHLQHIPLSKLPPLIKNHLCIFQDSISLIVVIPYLTGEITYITPVHCTGMLLQLKHHGGTSICITLLHIHVQYISSLGNIQWWYS